MQIMRVNSNQITDSKLMNQEEVIDLSQYFIVIKKYLWRIIGISVFAGILAAIFANSLTPLYKSKVSLLIDVDKTNVSPVQELYGLDSSTDEYFETQYEILQSRQIAEKVVARMELQETGYFNRQALEANKGAVSKFIDGTTNSIKGLFVDNLPFFPKEEKLPKSESQIEAAKVRFAVLKLMSSVTVEPKRNTQIVDIYVETDSGSLSARIANTVADVYMENYLEAKLEMTEKANEWLNASIQGLGDALSQAETRLASFDENNEVVDIDGVVGLTSERVQQLSDELFAAELLLRSEKSLYEKINSSSSSVAQLSTLPEVSDHQSVQAIKRDQIVAQSNVSELRQIYGPKHPRMISALAELSSITESLESQIRNLISGITTRYREAEKNVTSLRRDLNVAKSEQRRLTSVNNERRSLQRDVVVNQQLYDSFYTRLNETDQLGGFETANASILDDARPPSFASKPKKSLIIAAAVIFSLILCTAIAFLVEKLNSGIRSSDDVERKLFQKMLGIIPLEPRKRKGDLAIRHFFDPKNHIFSEAIRTFRTSLQLSNMNTPPKTILVTSSVPQEGKSTVSVNLSFALGQLKKVLLIDTDLRRPSIGKLFSIPAFQPGLANVIAGSHTLEECIIHDDQSKIDVLTAGSLPPNPQELLASEQFADLINKLKGTYDQIVLDSAPTQAVSDSVVVSKYCDSLVYVVRSDSTSAKLINNGLSRFVEAGQRIDGVVLNQVDLKKAKRTGEFSGYYDQYGYNSYQEEK